MSHQPPRWTKPEELKRLLMEEPAAAKEYIRDNLPGAVDALRGAEREATRQQQAIVIRHERDPSLRIGASR